jgi:hypothetical protein
MSSPLEAKSSAPPAGASNGLWMMSATIPVGSHTRAVSHLGSRPRLEHGLPRRAASGGHPCAISRTPVVCSASNSPCTETTPRGVLLDLIYLREAHEAPYVERLLIGTVNAVVVMQLFCVPE